MAKYAVCQTMKNIINSLMKFIAEQRFRKNEILNLQFLGCFKRQIGTHYEINCLMKLNRPCNALIMTPSTITSGQPAWASEQGHVNYNDTFN